MKLLLSSVSVVVATAIVVFAVHNVSTELVKPTDSTIDASTVQVKSYILHGASSEYLNQLVAGVGGDVSQEFPIINAVSALLTSIQASQIREQGHVRIVDDRTIVNSGKDFDDDLVDYDSNEHDKHDKKNKKSKINNFIAEQTNAKKLHDKKVTGKKITVAIIDSGANLGGTIGEYLFRDTKGKQRVPVKYDVFEGQESFIYNDDQNGHGTHIAGIIASSLSDDYNVYNGIAPNINLLPVKAFDANGESSYSKVLHAINWVFENRKQYKIRVVNMSLGAEVQGHYWNDPINLAVMRLWDAGIVVVSSAGNNGEHMGITVPGNTPYIITVGAVTDSNTPYDKTDDRLATFSAKGPTYEGFVKPEVLAYGSRIATKLDERFLKNSLKSSTTGDHYSEVSGTSQAAAIVSGIAALIISNDKKATPDEVKCRLMQTAVPASNNVMATYSPFEQGAGLVDAFAAINSKATNCANTNLNIKEDLMGINHFIGPTKIDDNGDYFIELSDGTLFTKGLHWGGTDVNLDGIHWGGRTDLILEGLHWGGQELMLKGMFWSGKEMDLQGMYWADADIGLKGIHWGSKFMNLNGLHWGNKAIDVQSMNWNNVSMGLQSTDLDLEPIDPDGEVPMIETGWK